MANQLVAPPPAKGTGNRRREEIFDAAARIFNQKGYAGTSIQDVADAVGILKGSLYYYIDSKEDLLFQIIQDVHRGSLERMTELESSRDDVLTKLRAFIEGHVVTSARNLEKIGVFFHDFRSLSPERRAVIVAERDRYDRFLRDLLRRGQEEGVLRADADPKLVSMAILGAMNWLYQWYKPGGGAEPEQVAREFAEFVLAGLASDRSAVGTQGS